MLQVLMVALDFQVLDCVDNLIAHLVGNCIRTREREKKRSSYKLGNDLDYEIKCQFERHLSQESNESDGLGSACVKDGKV